jgi:hypothetical protein
MLLFIPMNSALAANSGNFNFGKPLTVTLSFQKIFASLELDDADLFTAISTHNFAGYSTRFNVRCAYVYIIAIGNQQNLVKNYFFARLCAQHFQPHNVTFRDAVLLTAALKNRKHISTPGDQLMTLRHLAVLSVAKIFVLTPKKVRQNRPYLSEKARHSISKT